MFTKDGIWPLKGVSCQSFVEHNQSQDCWANLCRWNGRHSMINMHNTAPAHFTQNVQVLREWLAECISNIWVGGGGSFLWSARSPDINPVDSFA
ncbi:hypothetical protein Trydic_g11306 [Trypoxylus dichotomus]